MATKQLTNLGEMAIEQLKAEVTRLQDEYRIAKLEHVTKGMANPMELRYSRREIARLLTEIRVREIAE